MSRERTAWARAGRGVTVAAVLCAALAIAATNFVLVDVRIVAFDIRTRLAWAILVPTALAFAAGTLHGRARVASVSADRANAIPTCAEHRQTRAR